MPFKTRDRFVWDVEDLDPGDLTRFGGKGVGLARMVKAGIPVPPGFVIGTDAYRAYHSGGAATAQLDAEIDEALARLEARTRKRFGGSNGVDSSDEPLLVSVRSGAPVSMPGMMDTVLNLGLDASRTAVFARTMNDVPFAIDTWLRFWRMFAEIVIGVDASKLEDDVAGARSAALVTPSSASFDLLERAVLATLAQAGAVAIQTSPRAQLGQAISAVFGSWNSRRAKTYRANLQIPDNLGTAVTIQAMVFGNRDDESGSGVAFSCNPNTGERGLFGEYVRGRQGEDLVSGTATPIDLSAPDALSAQLRDALRAYGRELETLYCDAVDIEFTVESNRLYLLQVRSAKRTAEAAVRIAVDLHGAGTISREEIVRRVTPEQLGKLLRPTFDATALEQAHLLATGIGSSPGHAAGVAVVTSDEAAQRAAAGVRVILLRPTTSPQDIRGMLAADGIVTARGGALSHAAVVSRALDKPCIVGCEAIGVDVPNRCFTAGGQTYAEGTTLSIDGESGRIYLADIPLRPAVTGRAQLVELIEAATAISQAHVAVAALDFADVARASASAADAVIVGLTDLLLSAGDIERLTDAIGALEDEAQAQRAETQIESLARAVAARALQGCTNVPIAFRLPSFLSERARQIVPTWAALPARSLLPLGQQRFYAPMARGVATAASGNTAVSLLLGGVTEFAEVEAFARELASMQIRVAGAIVRSFAGVQNFSQHSGGEMTVWVDVDAVVRSAYGFPSELMSARGVLSEYQQRGYFTHDPQQTLAPFLLAAFDALLQRIGPQRAGVLCGTAAESGIVVALYGLGYRRFCVPVNEREQVCLRVARAAIGAA